MITTYCVPHSLLTTSKLLGPCLFEVVAWGGVWVLKPEAWTGLAGRDDNIGVTNVCNDSSSDDSNDNI